MKITEAKELIIKAQEEAVALLKGDGIVVDTEIAEEVTEGGNSISGLITISAEGSPEVSVTVETVAMVEESGEVDEQMLRGEIVKLGYTAKDYSRRLRSCTDKAGILKQIIRLEQTGFDEAEEKRGAKARAKTYKIAILVAAVLMVASAIGLIIEMIVK